MQHTDISELMKNYSSYMDKDITVCGWIKSVRDSKQTCFIELNDGTGMKNVQIVIDKTTFTDESVMKQNVGDKILVRGKRQGTGGEYVDIDFGVTVGYKQ